MTALEKIRNGAMIIMLLSIAYSAYIYAETYSNSVQPGSYRTFTVIGEGKVVSIPDVGTFTFSVLTEGKLNVEEIQKENTEKMNDAITFLKQQGIEAKDIKTENYSISPRYQYIPCPAETREPCPPSEIVGYSISQNVTVKVRDLTKVSTLLSGIVEAGANNVSQLTFTTDDPTEIQNQAKTKAIEDAKKKAEVIAEAGDFTVGKLISIYEDSYYPPPMPLYGRGGGYAEDAASMKGFSAPVIEPGSQENVVRVTLTYEIK